MCTFLTLGGLHIDYAVAAWLAKPSVTILCITNHHISTVSRPLPTTFATPHFLKYFLFLLFGSLMFVSAWWIWALPVMITISMRCSWEPLIFSLNTEAYLGLLFFFLTSVTALQATIFLTDLLCTEDQQWGRKGLCWCFYNKQCLCEYLQVAWKQHLWLSQCTIRIFLADTGAVGGSAREKTRV